MRVTQSSIFPAPAETIFDLLSRGDTIKTLTKGFPISYRNPRLPETWCVGTTINLRPRLFGIPQGDHFVTFIRIDPDAFVLKTREYGGRIRRWNHTMTLKPLPNNCCQYTDTVLIEAGYMTPLVWVLATLLYRHRHGRLRKLLAVQTLKPTILQTGDA